MTQQHHHAGLGGGGDSRGLSWRQRENQDMRPAQAGPLQGWSMQPHGPLPRGGPATPSPWEKGPDPWDTQGPPPTHPTQVLPPGTAGTCPRAGVPAGQLGAAGGHGVAGPAGVGFQRGVEGEGERAVRARCHDPAGGHPLIGHIFHLHRALQGDFTVLRVVPVHYGTHGRFGDRICKRHWDVTACPVPSRVPGPPPPQAHHTPSGRCCRCAPCPPHPPGTPSRCCCHFSASC